MMVWSSANYLKFRIFISWIIRATWVCVKKCLSQINTYRHFLIPYTLPNPMKKVYFYLLFSLIAIYASANHITGGEMYYTLTNQNGNMYTYYVVLNLYRDCFSNGAPLDGDVSISIFDNAGFSTVWNNDNIPRSKIVHLNLSSPSPCIQNPPVVCYDVGYYEFDVTLPGIASGYTITFQRCCRIAGIN